ncbi:MAG: hypothetical protein ACREE9_14920 [Stellaceae bacterium]
MTTLKPSYGSPTTVTITTGSLASDAGLLAGRQSNIADNTSDLADECSVGLAIAAPGAAPTAGTFIEVWVFWSWDGGTTFSAGASGGGDANFSPPTTGVKYQMSRAALLSQDDATARPFDVGFMLSDVIGGQALPDHWGVFIVHNLAVTLGATTLKYTPIQYTNS